MAKLVHPAGATSCNIEGETYQASAAGIFTIPDDKAHLLAAHGFTPYVKKEGKGKDADDEGEDLKKVEAAGDLKKD